MGVEKGGLDSMKLMVEILPFDDAASHFPSECIGTISINVSIEKCRVILEYRSHVGRKSTIVKGVGRCYLDFG